MKIIPAIDLIDGKCVRLTQGDYARQKTYNEDPLEVAQQFEDAGLDRLHLVDLDGARAGKVVNWKVLEKLAVKTQLTIDFGGGIKQDDDIRAVFESGAAMATVGSMAVKQPAVFHGWLGRYGSERLLLGADVKEEKIAVSGWTEDTDILVYDFIRDQMAAGVTRLFCTDISRDGLLEGPALELYRQIIGQFPGLHFIASGGVSTVDDLVQLKEIGCRGAIVGKAIYEGKIKISDLRSIC
ncbi:1-(5-phosphoribosyl)-5-[(5-phosphoribosylamino)methylideneamino]imidazole-4-carboxamide isomerase [Compostibacter hankyongensis]|uniref:1-(5-phosphoribosyl)-5-[(5-phosphoribosylamino)methylideneamino] imidazole-4-carboxamide isomerase n=1 Tax=Compostibacter hankyongensis TaxID=1007089 RepID=A0ABP8FXQ1_9BACT